MTNLSEQPMTPDDKKMLMNALTAYLFFYMIIFLYLNYSLVTWKTSNIVGILLTEIFILLLLAGLAAMFNLKLFKDILSGKVLVGQGTISEIRSRAKSRGKYIQFDITGDDRIQPLGNILHVKVGDVVKVRISVNARLLLKIEPAS